MSMRARLFLYIRSVCVFVWLCVRASITKISVLYVDMNESTQNKKKTRKTYENCRIRE